MSGLNGHRAEVERKADLLRERLLRTIDALDQRRHEITDVKLQVQRHAPSVAAAIAALSIVGAGGIALAAYRASTRDQRMRRERIRALGRSWRHPDRVARQQKQSVLWQIGRKALIGTAGFVVVALLRRVVRDALLLPPAATAREHVPELSQ